MPKLILTKGLPASGKSTWAREVVAKSKGGTVGITKDDLRLMFSDTKRREKLVLLARDELTKIYLKEGLNVIWHDTNLNPAHQEKAVEIAREFNSTVSMQDFTDVNVEECIKRDGKRENSVGKHVIRAMYNQYLAHESKKYIEDTKLPHVILCDIDGTIAVKGDRGIFDWAKVGVDLPNTHICQVVSSLIKTGNRIIFFSGRDKICFSESVDWIAKNIPELEIGKIELYMRPIGDVRPDTVIKKELYESVINGKFYVDFVLDDRMSVIRMWQNDLGIPVISANPLGIEF